MRRVADRMPLAIWCSAPASGPASRAHSVFCPVSWFSWPAQLRAQLVTVAIVLACLTFMIAVRGDDSVRRSFLHRFTHLDRASAPTTVHNEHADNAPCVGHDCDSSSHASSATMSSSERQLKSSATPAVVQQRPPCTIWNASVTEDTGSRLCSMDGAAWDQGVSGSAAAATVRYEPSSTDEQQHPCRWLALRVGHHAGNDTIGICAYPAGEDPCVSERVAMEARYHEFETAKVAAACNAARAIGGARPLFLDVGAQIGVFSVIAAAAGCDVIAVDPLIEHASRVHRSLQRVAAARGVRFLVLRAAAMHVHGWVNITRHPRTPAASFVKHPQARMWPPGGSYPDGVPQRVPTVVLDDAVHDGPWISDATVVAVKTDAENYDIPALVGLRRTLSRSDSLRTVIVDLVPRQAETAASCDATEFVRWMGTLQLFTEDPETHGRWEPAKFAEYIRQHMMPETGTAAPARHVIFERDPRCSVAAEPLQK